MGCGKVSGLVVAQLLNQVAVLSTGDGLAATMGKPGFIAVLGSGDGGSFVSRCRLASSHMDDGIRFYGHGKSCAVWSYHLFGRLRQHRPFPKKCDQGTMSRGLRVTVNGSRITVHVNPVPVDA